MVDVEAVLVTALQTAFPDVRLCTELPANLDDVLPVIQVARAGGGDTFPTLDAATVAVDTFAVSRVAASLLARQVHVWLRYTLPGTQQGDAVIGLVSTVTAPRWIPYDNTTLRRYTAAYVPHVKSTTTV